MTYRTPFTSSQRKDAVAVYRSMRITLRTVRSRFRPRDAEERHLADQFARSIRDFGEALVPSDAKINPRQLNALKDRATWLALQYAFLRNRPSGETR